MKVFYLLTLAGILLSANPSCQTNGDTVLKTIDAEQNRKAREWIDKKGTTMSAQEYAREMQRRDKQRKEGR